jgi:hypothetical protein
MPPPIRKYASFEVVLELSLISIASLLNNHIAIIALHKLHRRIAIQWFQSLAVLLSLPTIPMGG